MGDVPAQPAGQTINPATAIPAPKPADKPATILAPNPATAIPAPKSAGNTSGKAMDTSAANPVASPAGQPQSENAGAVTAP